MSEKEELLVLRLGHDLTAEEIVRSLRQENRRLREQAKIDNEAAWDRIHRLKEAAQRVIQTLGVMERLGVYQHDEECNEALAALRQVLTPQKETE